VASFSGRITVKVPNDEKLVIEPVRLLDVVKSLEGRWATPDPLAMRVREEELTPEGLTLLERKSTLGVRANDIAEELRTRLKEPRADSIRLASLCVESCRSQLRPDCDF
jgi:hypothetical protein